MTELQPRPALLTLSQVALELQVTRRHVYRLVSGGAMSVTRVGRSLRVSQAEITRFIEAHTERRGE
jgi:excisionase family DNA binding protein